MRAVALFSLLGFVLSNPSYGLAQDGGTPTCAYMECTDPRDLMTCYCPKLTPDGQKNPLGEEQCKDLGDVPEMSDDDITATPGGGGGGKGERRQTGKAEGTNNPFKKLRPHPKKPDKVLYEDPHTGKLLEKAKPAGFDEYWNSKHGR